jgi:subtilisin-like proprotein convertase family protein
VKADRCINFLGFLSADSKPLVNLPFRLEATAAFLVLLLCFTRLGAADFAEGNASSWSTFASDFAATSLSNDATHVKAGSSSLRFDTASGFDTGVKFPGSGATHWDLTTNTHLAFWHFGTNANQPTWQGAQPVVVLNCAGGNLRYEPTRQFTLDNVWSYVRVPLAGDAVWQVTSNGTPSLADVISLEIHQDTWGNSFTIWYDAVQFITTTNNLPPAGPPAPPGVDPDRLQPRVLMFAFDPFMPNKNNRRMHAAYGWTDPVSLTQQTLDDLRRSSHDRVVPILEAQVHDAWSIQSDGFQYDATSFDYDWTHGQIHNSEYDYKRFLLDWNLVPRILNGEVDEIWIYRGPVGGGWESTMAGDGGYWCNSGPVQGVPSSRLFVIMGLNFERGVGEALESFGHRSESILWHNYERWEVNRSNTWSAFTLLDKDAPGLGGVGNVHYPVNGQSDYDWGNTNFVPSNCDDWLYNYPNFQGLTKLVNYTEWSPSGQEVNREYLNWWYAHMPHVPGRAPDGYFGNWWRYLWDVEQFKSWNGSLYGTEGIPTVAITSPTNNAVVAGIVRVTANASASGALGRVDLYVDGQYHSSDTIAPYTFDWDTRGLGGSNHTLVAKAYELQNGTETVSAQARVSIQHGSISGQITSNSVPVGGVWMQLQATIPQTLYLESQVNTAIPDNQTGGITNNVLAFTIGPLRWINVGATVRHSRRGDVELDLISPSGQRVRLQSSSAETEKNLITFYPELTAPVDDLSALLGNQSSGYWQMVARDMVAGSNGVLEAWSIRFNSDWQISSLGTTNASGSFAFTNYPAGVYTVTPSGSNRWFWPPSITLTNVAESNVVNFIETAGPPPLIVTPPADQIVYAGDPAMFQVVASGLSVTYQWQRSGTNLPGATGTSLVFTNVQPPDIGLYRVVVSNANGWAVSPEAALAFAELTEGNAIDWDTFASDGATASTADDTTHVKVGQRSVRFDTQSGFDTGVIYPREGNAAWNLSNQSHLLMWIYADNPNFAFQGPQPVIILKGPGGSFRYEPQQEVMPNQAWSFHQIPLAGDALWLRTVTGTPSLAHIDQLEIHQDTWAAGFTIYYDGVEFAALSPPHLANVGRDANSRIHFDLIGLTSHDYDVEVSDDLFHWNWLTTLTSTNRSTHFENTPPGNANAQFYRVREH